MIFSCINIQGNIVSSEILDKIRTEEKFKHQSPEAFGLARSASLRDEIGHAWAIMRTHWQAYKKRLESLPTKDSGTSLTRERLVIPLLAELGYETSRQNAQQINGKSYAISHGAANQDLFPIHIMGYNDHLDKRRESGGPRLSPHALVQEYLNNTEHLYALVTNGKQLRLLRDATRLVRMSFLEFDLQRMFEEELYADFSMLYRVLHASRMPKQIDAGSEAVIEYYHQESMASGTRIREKLSEAVEESIKTLANGFLHNRKNETLIALFENKSLTAETYYTHQLRLIYRILFLIVLEERKIIYPENPTEEQLRFRSIYYKYYSVERLRKLTENRVYVDEDKYDLWESLKTTFLLFEEEQFGTKIGIKPLGSGLFASNALGNLKKLVLKNGDLLEVLKRLTTFVDDRGQLVRVNYSDLDVEEFGSIYEGLLEYDPVVEKIGVRYQFSFVLGDDRSSSGSHYTPEELVKPLIKHSLDYIIADKLKEANPEEALLLITVCDVACGSGHILLSAARKIATELASIREGAEQPSPTYYRAAIRDVIRNCIYGVDLNPLAVELCKVALWLEAHNPNEPLNFLDHHIKNGNAIVGLAHFEELQNGIANEAFKTLPGDDKTFARELKKKNTLERKSTIAENKSYGQQIELNTEIELSNSLKGLQKEFAEFVALPEKTPEQIDAKTKAYQDLTSGKKWYRLKNLADLQVAQFFIPKTIENKEKLTTEAEYRTHLNAGTQILDRGASMALAQEKRFFHWFLEFPEVFGKGGFDCILGNPPFLGGKMISSAYGDTFLNYIKNYFAPAIGGLDLVVYFFRRDFQLTNSNGFQSLISTNTISQGDSRIGGLDTIISQGGFINYAVKSMNWPGVAAVKISLVSIKKGNRNIKFFLNNREVKNITSYLDDNEPLGHPLNLKANAQKSFIGSVVNGKGFIITKAQAEKLISENSKYKDVVFAYLNGKDLNSNHDQSPSRYIINFFQWNENKAKSYPSAYSILSNIVRPERKSIEVRKTAKGQLINNDDKKYIEKWWVYGRPQLKLYDTIRPLSRVLVHTRVTKTHAYTFVSEDMVHSDATVTFAYDSFDVFAILQSSLNEWWAWNYSSTMKGDRRYSPSDAFENFPFPAEYLVDELDLIGSTFYKFRKSLMSRMLLGLTKVYNQFHNKDLAVCVDTMEADVSAKECAKETWNLYNHLKVKKEGNISYEEAVPLIFKLRELHKRMDEAVLAAYGWEDIQLRHDFHEVDYLPENDRVRYTIHPEARTEVLKRLLLLNHERFEEEVAKSLHKRKEVEAYFQQKGKPVPDGTSFSDGKAKQSASRNAKVKIAAEPKEQYVLFTESSSEIKDGCKVTLKKANGGSFKYHVLKTAIKDQFTGDYKQIEIASKLAQQMLNRKAGDTFMFGSSEYEIVAVI